MINIEIQRNCAYCPLQGMTPDTNKHLYINTVKKVCYCHRCGYKGKWDGSIIIPETVVKKKTAYDNIDIYNFDIETEESKKIFDYCISRLPENVVRKRVRWSPQVQARAIFPVWSQSKICIWQARTVLPNVLPKYLNWGKQSEYLYNFASVKDDWAVLTEGPIDALSSPNGIALFGKSISNMQLRILISRFNKIFWALDGDTVAQAKIKNMKSILKEFVEVIDIQLEGDEDPASIGMEEMERRIKWL